MIPAFLSCLMLIGAVLITGEAMAETTITLADVLKKIDDDLAWRGPQDKLMRHVVMRRELAEYLKATLVAVIKERDELLLEKERREKAPRSVG